MFSRIYIDNSATTPVDPRVLDAMLPFLKEDFGNASSIHHFGQRARAAVDKARHHVASALGSPLTGRASPKSSLRSIAAHSADPHIAPPSIA